MIMLIEAEAGDKVRTATLSVVTVQVSDTPPMVRTTFVAVLDKAEEVTCRVTVCPFVTVPAAVV